MCDLNTGRPARVRRWSGMSLALVISSVAMAAPQLAVPGEVLFRDDFSRAELGAAWKTNDVLKKAPGQSRIVDGTLVTFMAPHSDHGATVSAAVDFKDAVLTCRFRLSDDKGFNVPINDKEERTVHAGHICRLRITPGRVQVQDDASGVMNLALRERKKDPKNAAAVAAALGRASAVFPAPVEIGKWHELRLELAGDEMLVWIDGRIVGHLASPGIAHPTKRGFGFTVPGQTGVAFDDVKVFRATPAADWSRTRTAALTQLRPIGPGRKK